MQILDGEQHPQVRCTITPMCLQASAVEPEFATPASRWRNLPTKFLLSSCCELVCLWIRSSSFGPAPPLMARAYVAQCNDITPLELWTSLNEAQYPARQKLANWYLVHPPYYYDDERNGCLLQGCNDVDGHAAFIPKGAA